MLASRPLRCHRSDRSVCSESVLRARRALRTIGPGLALPIHFDDYTVFNSPLSEFQEAVRHAGLESSVRYLNRGEMLPLPP